MSSPGSRSTVKVAVRTKRPTTSTPGSLRPMDDDFGAFLDGPSEATAFSPRSTPPGLRASPQIANLTSSGSRSPSRNSGISDNIMATLRREKTGDTSPLNSRQSMMIPGERPAAPTPSFDRPPPPVPSSRAAPPVPGFDRPAPPPPPVKSSTAIEEEVVEEVVVEAPVVEVVEEAKAPEPERPKHPILIKLQQKPTVVPKVEEKYEDTGNDTLEPLSWPSTSVFGQPDTESCVIFDKDEDGNSRLKASTPEKIVEKMTAGDSGDSNLMTIILLTYRSFITPSRFLDLLRQRYPTFEQPLPEGNRKSVQAFINQQQKPIRLRIVNILKTWISNYFADFYDDMEILEKLVDFTRNVLIPGGMESSADVIERLLERKLEGAESKQYVFNTIAPKPILPSSTNRFTVLDLHPKEIARQLTLIEYDIYRNIKPRELQNKAWSEKLEVPISPNVLGMTDRFNSVSNWVVTEVLQGANQKVRVNIIRHFLEVADQCRVLNNFNAAMEVISGLNDSAIWRLKNHFAELPPPQQKLLEELRLLLSSDKNYANLRAALKNVELPVIPYLGMFLTDLTFIEDGNQNKIGQLVNVNKRRFVGGVISDILFYQQAPYNLEAVPFLQDWLKNLPSMHKDTAYARSLEILPRVPKGTGGTLKGQATEEDDDDFGPLEEIKTYLFYEKDSERNIRFKGDKISVATLEKLVEKTTLPTPNEKQTDVVLFAYRQFCNPKRLFELLNSRFNLPKPKTASQVDRWRQLIEAPTHQNIFDIFAHWVEKYPFDFEDKVTAELLNTFVKNKVSPLHRKMSRRLALSLKKLAEGGLEPKRIVSKIKPPQPFPLSRGANPSSPKLTDFHPEEIARQLCIIDYQTLSGVRLIEFVGRGWEKVTSRKRINLRTLWNRGRALRVWVIETITADGDLTARRNSITNFINVARACLDLKNYFAATRILLALQSSEINQQTWEGVQVKMVERFKEMASMLEKLETFKSFLDNYGNPGEDPCIPNLAAFIKEAEQIELNVPDSLDGMVNYEKFVTLYEISSELEKYQLRPYNFEPVAFLQKVFKSLESQDKLLEVEEEELPKQNRSLANVDPKKIRELMSRSVTVDKKLKTEIFNAMQETLRSQVELDDGESLRSHSNAFKRQIRSYLDPYTQLMKTNQSELEMLIESAVETEFPDSQIREWGSQDHEGIVYGWPTEITVNYVDNDGEVVLLMAHSKIDKAEISTALRLKSFYDETKGANSRLMLITKSISERSRVIAEETGIEVIKMT